VDERARGDEVGRDVDSTALAQGFGERERASCHVPNMRDQELVRQIEIALCGREPGDVFEIRDVVVGHRRRPGIDDPSPKAVVFDPIQFGEGGLDGVAVVAIVVVVRIVHAHRTPQAIKNGRDEKPIGSRGKANDAHDGATSRLVRWVSADRYSLLGWPQNSWRTGRSPIACTESGSSFASIASRAAFALGSVEK